MHSTYPIKPVKASVARSIPKVLRLVAGLDVGKWASHLHTTSLVDLGIRSAVSTKTTTPQGILDKSINQLQSERASAAQSLLSMFRLPLLALSSLMRSCWFLVRSDARNVLLFSKESTNFPFGRQQLLLPQRFKALIVDSIAVSKDYLQ